MQWKVSSSLAAITSLFLLATVDLVAAQITAPFCTDIGSWLWSYNSLDQSPCDVAAYLLATCYNGVFNMLPLNPGSSSYAGPSIEDALEADSCWCNTVIYSLGSACSECQGAGVLYWPEFYQNCTTILAPATFPNPVPAGTRVPQWVLLGIPSTNYWSPSTAELVGDIPEIFPGELLDGPAIVPKITLTIPTPSHTFVQATTSSIPSPGSVLNQGSIVSAGGVLVTTMATITSLVLTLSS